MGKYEKATPWCRKMERFLQQWRRKLINGVAGVTDGSPRRDQRQLLYALQSEVCGIRLERNHAVDAICPENAEFTLVVTTKVDETAATLAGAG